MARDETDARQIPQAVRDCVTGPADLVLTGEVGDRMLCDFLARLEDVRGKDGDIVLCCTTPGGDAEMVRRIVLEIERLRDQHRHQVYFLGKSVVYSAGVSAMSAFPRTHRFLTEDTILLIHGRQLTKTIELDGPIRASKKQVEGLLHQFEVGIRLEEDGFAKLLAGSTLELADVIDRAAHNWYVTAQEALEMKLVQGLL